MPHTVYLALGSNLGDRAAHIYAALKEIGRFADVEATSPLYETPPAYVIEQPEFLNAACKVQTKLSPRDLLWAVEDAMHQLGRKREVRYGPRIIDIDILFYDNICIESADLVIPHPLLAERDFVLVPLCDIAPNFLHPILKRPLCQLLAAQDGVDLQRVFPFGKELWAWGKKTYIMGIVNATADSFSGDGIGQRGSEAVARAVVQGVAFAADGADCLDIGGQTTKPGHTLISVDEEIARVVPIIEALRVETDLPISVDTFRSEVARAAVAAGASLINDVWGLRFDPEIASVAANADANLLVMHNRAKIDYIDQVDDAEAKRPYIYDDIVKDIETELRDALNQAETAGVPRWGLVADPGIGFGKNLAQHLELIARLGELQNLRAPLLFGASRKGFIGKLVGDLPPEERDEGTLALGVMAIERGIDMVRVHNVRAMVRAALMADAVTRDRP